MRMRAGRVAERLQEVEEAKQLRLQQNAIRYPALVRSWPPVSQRSAVGRIATLSTRSALDA
jgi:hypothetical protein